MNIGFQRPEQEDRSVNFLYSISMMSAILASSVYSIPPTGQSEHEFVGQVAKTVRLKYLLFLPKGYGEDPDQKWPLIVFLHGMGERGDDLEKVKIHGIPKIVEKQADFPFIAVSPQCPDTSRWTDEIDTLNALLDDVAEKYASDENRLYLTGLSMGGFGTWAWAIASPDRFAAIAPICGGGDPGKVCAIKNVPTWVFHGAKDQVVPIARSEDMVKALKDCGGNVEFTVYPEAGHDSWTETYNNPKLYEWFLKHSLKER